MSFSSVAYKLVVSVDVKSKWNLLIIPEFVGQVLSSPHTMMTPYPYFTVEKTEA